jgi:hypothetical protein
MYFFHTGCFFLYSFSCLHHHGRYRIPNKETSTNYLISTDSRFPFFCYYTHDIEDGIEATKHWEALGGADFLTYNLLLLWLLPSLSSITVQLCVRFGFIISIQIGIMITKWIGSLWKQNVMLTVPFPVIVVSTYAILVDFITQSLDIDNHKMLG